MQTVETIASAQNSFETFFACSIARPILRKVLAHTFSNYVLLRSIWTCMPSNNSVILKKVQEFFAHIIFTPVGVDCFEQIDSLSFRSAKNRTNLPNNSDLYLMGYTASQPRCLVNGDNKLFCSTFKHKLDWVTYNTMHDSRISRRLIGVHFGISCLISHPWVHACQKGSLLIPKMPKPDVDLQ